MLVRIVKIKFGSHLYGTSTPQSDLDWRSVIIPPARDILLQKRTDAFSAGPLKNPKDKNLPGDIDEMFYSLQKFLTLVAQGEIGALDMLFAPPESLEFYSSVWEEIQANTHRLITTQSAAFVGYCRQQANKYGIKGSRVESARKALAFLRAMEKEFGNAKLGEFKIPMFQFFRFPHDHIFISEIEQANGRIIKHLEVCGRKLPFTVTVKYAGDIVQKLVDEYGHRALLAEKNEGIDWKALSHAVRAGYQALELFQTGRITFPRPEAALLINIKTGSLKYSDIGAAIEKLLEDVEEAAKNSTLPDKADLQWIDDFVCENYKRAILNWE